MSNSQLFKDNDPTTPVTAGWLNDLNLIAYNLLGSSGTPPATSADIVRNLGLYGYGGLSAFTQLTASFVQPAVGATVIVAVTSSLFVLPGQYVYVAGGGTYYVSATPSGQSMTLRNGGATGNASPGTTVNAGAGVSCAGTQGAQGATGATGPTGPTGPAGTNGTNGTNGLNGASAFTTTAANFSQPVSGGTVSVQFASTAWMAQGQILYITGGGYYTLNSITDSTHGVLQNLGYAGNVTSGTTVTSGAAVTAGGVKGQDGAGSGTVTSVGLALPADFSISGSPVTGAGTLTGAWATTPTGTGAMVRATGATVAHPTVSDYTLFTTQGTAPTYAAGVLFYETSNDALTFFNSATNNDVHLGQEVQIRAYNQTGATITAGSVVYINGQHSQFPTIALAQANALATSNGIGVVNTDIANNAYGYVVTLGKFTGLNTSGFTSGDSLYVSPTTAGLLTNTLPTAPNYAVKIGTCIYSNPSQGVVYVSDGPVYVNASAVIGTLAVANGGTGVATLTGIAKGNGTSAFSAATAGTDYVAPGTATTFTATQLFSGSSSVFAAAFANAKEITNVVGTALGATPSVYVASGATTLVTASAANNVVPNIAFSSGTSLNTAMAVGDTVTIAMLLTQGATAYYVTGLQIDGSAVTPKWLGGTAPSAGNASGIDAYTFTITKTASATYTVLAAQSQYK